MLSSAGTFDIELAAPQRWVSPDLGLLPATAVVMVIPLVWLDWWGWHVHWFKVRVLLKLLARDVLSKKKCIYERRMYV